MALSGSYNFQLDVGEIIEEAFELAGMGESYTGNDFRTARRSLNLILTDWTNRGINLWTLDLVTQSLVVGQNSYTLTSYRIDILDAAYRDSNGSDTSLDRISLQTYLKSRTNKTTSGSPSEYTLERNSNGGHTLYVYPAPSTTDSIVYWAISYPQDVSTTGGSQTVDVPRRFLPALTKGLAYELACKNKETAPDRLAMLKSEYETSLMRAMEEDRERTSLFLTPGGYRI